MDEKRRTPKQKRSQVTRDAVVEAAARVFAEVGLANATTARIAEVAGVSPGSMYHYFPSKDSLVVAILEREADGLHRRFMELAAEMGISDVPRLIRAFVDAMLRTFEDQRKLYRVMLDEVPRLFGLGPTQMIDERVARSVRLLLELGKDRVRARDLDHAAMLLVRTCRYTTVPLVPSRSWALRGSASSTSLPTCSRRTCFFRARGARPSSGR